MELIGRRFGHIRITDVVGQGGMGDVYAGYDEKLDRKVALKVLHAENRLDAESRERLLREARALSKVDHPNICRIYDYVETSTVDVLVLEFIDGRTLQEVVEREELSRAEKLRIAIALTDVLVAAHRLGIIHRDLKPENVMLTNAGEVKVLDFGLARWLQAAGSGRHRAAQADEISVPVTTSSNSVWFPVGAEESRLTVVRESASGGVFPEGESFRTEAGVTMGTPLYMSPEQARGEELTTASDLFSLGLLLQFLFTGGEPHPDGLMIREVMLRAAHGQTLPVRGADGDITALIGSLKQFAPADRPTAVETAGRLRYMADKPRRVLRRSLAAAAILVTVFGVWRYTVDLSRERAEAQRRRAQAEDLINFMVGDLRAKLEPVQRLDIFDDVAEKALKYVGSSNKETATTQELIAQVQTLNQLGEVRIGRGDLAGAMTLFEQSLDRAATAVRRDPKSDEAKYVLALSRFWLGNVCRLQDDPTRGLEHARAYLAITSDLAARHPADSKYVLESAYAHSQVGMLLEDKRDLKGAIAEFRRALAIKEAEAAKHPTDTAKEDIARTMNKLAFAMQKDGDWRTARRYFESEVALREDLAARNPQQIRWKHDLAVSHNFLAFVLEDLGEADVALPQRLSEVRLNEELVAHDPANATWKRNLVRARSALASVLRSRGDLDGAERQLLLAEEASGMLAAADPKRASHRADLTRAKVHYARVLLARGRPDAARQKVREAIAVCGSDAANRGQLGYAYLVEGQLRAREGQIAAARESWMRAAELLRPKPDSSNARELENWARVLIALGQREEAIAVIARLRALGFKNQEFESLCRSEGYT